MTYNVTGLPTNTYFRVWVAGFTVVGEGIQRNEWWIKTSKCLGGTNNVISPVGKPDLLIVHIGVVPFGKKRNIKARQIIIQALSFFHRSSVSFFVRMRSSLRKFNIRHFSLEFSFVSFHLVCI